MTSSPGGSRTPFSSSFYSLSCETYSGTRLGPRAGLVFVRRVGLLFAVVRDVQRNHHRWFVGRLPGHGFYSLRARRTAELVALQHATSRRSTFLFTVVRDVQRNGAPSNAEKRGRCFYSLSCETYSGTARRPTPKSAGAVSIRCRARRTAELRPSPWRSGKTGRFLFAVVRDVQRNSSTDTPTSARSAVSIRCRARRTAERSAGVLGSLAARCEGFYSLSCETYSGTWRLGLGTVLARSFYSLSCETYSGTTSQGWSLTIGCWFLFAVVRDVQRNRSVSPRQRLYYVSIRCRARRTAEQDHRDQS